MRSRRNTGITEGNVRAGRPRTASNTSCDAELVDEQPVRLVPPVVEVAGDDQRRIRRHRLADALAQRADLPLAPALEEPEVDVDAMQRRARRGPSLISQWSRPRLSNACAEMSRFSCATIGKRDSTRVAVMAVARRPRSCRRRPRARPVSAMNSCCGLTGQSRCRAAWPLVDAEHLLQEQDVGGEPVQPLAQLVDHHPPVELREALVDVVGRDGEAHGGTRRWSPCILAAGAYSHAVQATARISVTSSPRRVSARATKGSDSGARCKAVRAASDQRNAGIVRAEYRLGLDSRLPGRNPADLARARRPAAVRRRRMLLRVHLFWCDPCRALRRSDAASARGDAALSKLTAATRRREHGATAPSRPAT